MLRIGVFGIGHTGRLHVEQWNNIPGVSITGFYDPDDNAAGSFPLPRFHDPASLLDAVDAIDITSAALSLTGIAETAIRKGKHVFTCQPMAADTDAARQLVNLAKEAGIKFQVDHAVRFNPALLAAKSFSLQPSYIDVQRQAPLENMDASLDMVNEWMIDDFDIVLSLVKSDVRSISACGTAVVSDTPDIIQVRIEFHNGAVANLQCNRCSMLDRHSITLYQKDIAVGIDLLTKQAEILQPAVPGEPAAYTFGLRAGGAEKKWAVVVPAVAATNPLYTALEAFTQAILQNTRTTITEMDGLIVMDLARQVREKTGSHKQDH